MVKQQEQRESPRIRIPSWVEVRLESGILIEGQAINASMNGLFFETERSLPLGSRVRVLLFSDRKAHLPPIECIGVVSRLDLRGVAIAWERVDSKNGALLQHLIQAHARDVPGVGVTVEHILD